MRLSPAREIRDGIHVSVGSLAVADARALGENVRYTRPLAGPRYDRNSCHGSKVLEKIPPMKSQLLHFGSFDWEFGPEPFIHYTCYV